MPINPSLRPKTRVRTAVLRDASAMASVFVDSWRSAYPGLLPERVLMRVTKDRIAPRLSARLAAGARHEIHLVAERVGGGIIGMAQAGPVQDKGLFIGADAVDSEIFTLYVSPDAQNEGAGRLLIQGMFEQLRLRGFKNTVAWMVEGNVTRFFYERIGARKIATRRAREWGTMVALEAYAWPALELKKQAETQ